MTVKRSWKGALGWFSSSLNNGMLEGLNSLIQSPEAQARGGRANRNSVAMISLIGSKLDINLTP